MPKIVPIAGDWVALAPAGYGQAVFQVQGFGGCIIRHDAAKPATNDRDGLVYRPMDAGDDVSELGTSVPTNVMWVRREHDEQFCSIWVEY
jgi:hypothetical protein